MRVVRRSAGHNSPYLCTAHLAHARTEPQRRTGQRRIAIICGTEERLDSTATILGTEAHGLLLQPHSDHDWSQ